MFCHNVVFREELHPFTERKETIQRIEFLFLTCNIAPFGASGQYFFSLQLMKGVSAEYAHTFKNHLV